MKYKNEFKTRLTSALETDSLKKHILVDEMSKDTSEETVFVDGERMSNESFKLLIDKLTEEFDADIKSNIIRSEIQSLEDFLDVLEGDCLFGDEYANLFSKMSNAELGLLGKIIFSDEMRDGDIDLSMAASAGNEMGYEWQELLLEFLRTMDNERLKLIEACMNGIAY
jgi:hypothetical protein